MKWWNYIDDETCKEKVSPVSTVEGGESLPALIFSARQFLIVPANKCFQALVKRFTYSKIILYFYFQKAQTKQKSKLKLFSLQFVFRGVKVFFVAHKCSHVETRRVLLAREYALKIYS